MWVRFWRRLGAVFVVLSALAAAHPALADTTVTTSPNPSAANQSFTITATMSVEGTWWSDDTIIFSIEGIGEIGSDQVGVSGQVSFTTSLPPGTYTIRASHYEGHTGDGTYNDFDTIEHVVNKASSTTVVASSQNPSNAGEPVTFTATVSGGGASPTGTVTFNVDGIDVAVGVALVAGKATFTTNALAAGSHEVTATYSGDALYATSNGALTQATIDSQGAATDLIEDFFETRAELILSHGPNRQRRIDRLNGIAPSSSDPASALLGLMPLVSGGGPRALSGSLGAIEQAVADPAEPAAFDIWFETSFGAYGSDAAQGNFGIAYLGADYLVSSDLLVGALFQLDQVGFDSNTGDASAEGTGWMIGPYVTARLGDNLYVDLRAAAGRSANSISPYGTYSDEVDASRWLIEAALSGEWTDGSWTFQPAARLSYFEESSDAYTDGLGVYVPSVTSGTGRLALGPALSYRFVTDGEIDVVLGTRLDGVLDFSLDGGALATDGAHAELEASIDLSLPGGARIGAAVKAGGLGEGDFRFLSGTVSVSAAIK